MTIPPGITPEAWEKAQRIVCDLNKMIGLNTDAQRGYIARAIMEAKAEEREACAKVVEDRAEQHEAAAFQPTNGPVPIPRHATAGRDLRSIATAIRQRGEE